MIRTSWVLLGILICATALRAQEAEPSVAVPASWIEAMKWRSIGPANMMGRITSFAVYEKDPNTWWASTASGGLLKTTNNGVTFEHQFDREATVSIGHVQVAQSDPNIVWVGTGEANPRNSVSWGDGVYKSTDGGKTWTHMGLKKSFQIGRIAIHPTNPDVVYVGVLGRLWGPSEERGLYKTSDGGKTWERVLYVDDKTGIIDVKMDPSDPETLIAASYERKRDGFDGNDPEVRHGPGSGLHKTTDGGKTWKKLSEGLPRVNLGRIGLCFYAMDPTHLYAVIESEKTSQRPEDQAFLGLAVEEADLGAKVTEVTKDSPAEKAGLKAGDLIFALNGELVISNDELIKNLYNVMVGDKVTLEYVREGKKEKTELEGAKAPEASDSQQGRGGRGRGGRGRGRGTQGRNPYDGDRLGGQEQNLQDYQGKDGQDHGGVYLSKDKGETWTRINSVNPRPMYYSQIRVDPADNNHIWVLGTSLYKSSDGGKTFSEDGAGREVHVDHHAMWVDPRDGRHVILGCDGGIYVTYDRGQNWDHHAHVAIGQFYHVGIDSSFNYKAYGGLQDNGSWGGPTRAPDGGAIINSDWFRVGGGDGFVCLVDPNDPDLVYYESQNGAMQRINFRTGDRGFIRPRTPPGQSLRYNWKTPFILSPHNSKIHYSAGNFAVRSIDRGNDAAIISPELTNTDKGAGSAIAESPEQAGVIYVGTTDGAVWITTNGGRTWQPLFSTVHTEEQTTPEADVTSRGGTGRGRGGFSGTRGPGGGRGGSGRGGSGRGGFAGPGMLTNLMENDANSDGKLQREEMPERMAALFDRIDANSDGVIEKSELDAMRQRFGAGRGRGGQAGPPPQRPRDAEASPSDQDPPADEAKAEQAKSDAPAEPQQQDPPAGDSEPQRGRGQADGPQGRGGVGRGGQGRGTGGPGFLANLMENDANQDGKLQRDEMPERLARMFDRMDANSDGVIEKSELDAMQQRFGRGRGFGGGRGGPARSDQTEPTDPARPQTDRPRRPQADTDQPSEPAADEPQRARPQGVFADLMKNNDANQDGKLQREELPDRLAAIFDRIDANADGAIDAQELEAMQLRMQGRGRGPQGRGRDQARPERPTQQPQAEEQAEQKAEAAEQKAEAAEKPAEQQATAEQKPEQKPEETPEQKPDDGFSGTWKGGVQGDTPFLSDLTFQLKLGEEGNVSGTADLARFQGEVWGKYDAEAKTLNLTVSTEQGFELEMKGSVAEGKWTGTIELRNMNVQFEVTRQTAAGEASDAPTTTLKDLLPGPRWVSSIETSKFAAGRCYMTFDGHRSNDDEPYVMMTENFGKSWVSIRGNLPTAAGSTRVIREDLKNENVLYLGTEFACWVSIDRGKSWTKLNGNLPTVAVHELAQHPLRGEMVAATHGRSLWVLDVTTLRQLTHDTIQADAHLYEPNLAVKWYNRPSRGESSTRRFQGENPPSAAQIYYSLGKNARAVKLSISDIQGNTLYESEGSTEAGLHSVTWNLRAQRPGQQAGRGGFGGRGGSLADTGHYRVTLNVDGQEMHQTLRVVNDPQNPAPDTDTALQEALIELFAGEEEGNHQDD